MQTTEMLERGGCLDEDSQVYERRDRTEVGLGKGESLSHHCRGRCWRKSWRLNIEERMSAELGADDSSEGYFAFCSHVSCKKNN